MVFWGIVMDKGSPEHYIEYLPRSEIESWRRSMSGMSGGLTW